MRILHLIPFLWSGAGDVVSRLAASQRAAGHQVLVVTSGRSRGQRDWPAYRRRLRAARVAWERVDLFDRQPESLWGAVAGVASLVAHWRPDVLHAHAGVPTMAAVLASRAVDRRVPVVSQFYNWGPDRPSWMDAMDTTAIRSADLVVCSARHYKARLAALGVPSRSIRLVPWGLDDRWFDDTANAVRRESQTIGFVGRLEPRKGQLELVRAFAVARRHLPELRLELVGPVADAAYAEAVRGAIESAGLDTSVRMVGHVPDVRRSMRYWAAFVSLSRDEGQGLAVLEAMAIGLPVVARAAPGVEDAVRHGRTGVILPAVTVAGQGAGLVRALNQPDVLDRLARRARAHVARRYRWSATVAAVVDAYEAASRLVPASERGRSR